MFDDNGRVFSEIQIFNLLIVNLIGTILTFYMRIFLFHFNSSTADYTRCKGIKLVEIFSFRLYIYVVHDCNIFCTY